jgi:hypothetical protein
VIGGRLGGAARWWPWPPTSGQMPGSSGDSPARSDNAWSVLRRAYNCRPMHRAIIERRLSDAHQRLVRARAELELLDEQLVVVNEIADDTRVQALVAESPAAAKDHDEASRHATAMLRNRQTLVDRIAELERRQDELLDRLVVGPG